MTHLIKPPSKLKLVTLLVLSALSANAFAEDADYTFSDSFIRGQHIKADFSKYASTSLAEGIYSLDVYTNGEWKGRYDLKATKQSDGKVAVCYDKSMLEKFGISVAQLNATLSKDNAFCGTLKEWKDDKDVHDSISKGALRLDITVPQMYQDHQFSGYVDPSMWDAGIPAINIGWNANVWNSHYSSAGSQDSTTGYLGLNVSASYAGWSLKHLGNLSWSDKNPTKWNSNKTYLQRPIATIDSTLSIGQISGSGEFFDSVTVRGISLKTDDNMYPDGTLSFSPEVRGDARTNALVTIRQNGNVIHQVTVSPGPFLINDIYPSGYGSDLEVSVKEADGTVSYFSVPINSTAKLLRPGHFRYELTSGKPDNSYIHNKPVIYQGTAQYGINNFFTGYGGVSGFNNYTSFLLGTGVNTPIGGFSADVTSSNFKKKDGTDRGNMYRLTYSKNFKETNTSFSVSAAKFSDKEFYSTSEALSYNSLWHKENRKSDISVSLSQSLPDGFGSFYLNSHLYEYWDGAKRDTQYQFGYNNHFGNLRYGVSAQKTRYVANSSSRTNNSISLNFSLPLDFSKTSSANLTSNTVINDSHYTGTQLGISGLAGERSEISYGVTGSTGDNKYVSLNGGYESQWSSLSGSYGQGSGYRQTSISGSGTALVHSGGVTFSSGSGDTLALVEAKGAKGAIISSSSNLSIDSNGYAVISNVRPYRVNNIEIDPKGAPDNVYFSDTKSQTVPYRGSVVKVKFGTEVQDNLTFKGKLSNGKPFPFGASVYNAQNVEIGTVGQGGNVFITNASQPNAHINVNDATCSFMLPKQNGETICN